MSRVSGFQKVWCSSVQGSKRFGVVVSRVPGFQQAWYFSVQGVVETVAPPIWVEEGVYPVNLVDQIHAVQIHLRN